jgi:hypothetical protein
MKERLLDAIYFGYPIPLRCKNCYPYDPEDSRDIDLRKNYLKKSWSDNNDE